jgi:predicted kinase
MATVPLPLSPLLRRTPSEPHPVVLMTCGLAGAGKSTLSKLVTATYPSFTRLSIDTIIHHKHGLYDLDYPPDKYAEYQAEADEEYDKRLLELLSDKDQKYDIVLDRSFWCKEDRDEVKRLVEEKGGRWVLVYLKASKEVLWRRIQERKAKRRDADSAYEVTAEVLERYWQGFEVPEGEGEIVIEVT